VHHTHASNLTPGQAVLAVIVLFCALAFYFLPTIMALKKNSPHKVAVIILNIFFGFTVVGWIVALVLGSKQPQPAVIVHNMPPPQPPR